MRSGLPPQGIAAQPSSLGRPPRLIEAERRGELRGEQRGELRGEQRGELRGEQRGELRGEQKIIELLGRLFTRRIGRRPTTEEERAIGDRTRDVGLVEVEDALLDLDTDALLRWLAGPVSRS